MTAPVIDAESLTRHDDFGDGRNNVDGGLASVRPTTEETRLVSGCGSIPSVLTAALEQPVPSVGPDSGTSVEALQASAASPETLVEESSPRSLTSTADPDVVPTDSAHPTVVSYSFPSVYEVTERLGIHSNFCFFCRGFYGPSFGQPVCGPCHAFLFPERAGEADFPRESAGSRQEEKDDSGDSGNEEPTDFLGAASSNDRARSGGGGEEYSVGNPVGLRASDGGGDEIEGAFALGLDAFPLRQSTSSSAASSGRQNLLSLEIDAAVLVADLDSPSSSSTSSQSSAADDIRPHNVVNDRLELGAVGVNNDGNSVVTEAGNANVVARPMRTARFPRESQINNGTPIHNVRSEKLAEKIIQMTTTKDKEVVPARLVDSLPPEVLIAIFSFLDDLSLWTAMQVSGRWRHLVADEYPDDTWRIWLKMRWPLFEPLLHPKSWREAYSRLVQSSPCLLCLEQMTIRNSPPIEENSWRHRRLRSELKALQSDPPEGIQAIPMDRFYCHWQATITGPQGSPYEGGVFFLFMQIPPSYPMKPPIVRFLTKTFHPNISRHGDIGLDSIHHNWSLALTISKVLISIQSLLTDPFIETSMEPQISSLILRDSEEYNRIARIWTWRYAMHDVMSVSGEELFEGP